MIRYLKHTFVSLLLIFSLLLISTPIKANLTPEVPSNMVPSNKFIVNTFLLEPNFSQNSWAGFRDVYFNLQIDKKGIAHFYTLVCASNPKYYCKINMKLQRYKKNTWTTLTSGTCTKKSDNMYSRSYYVSKGYKYRLYSKVYIYKSKNGKLVNSDIFTKTQTRK